MGRQTYSPNKSKCLLARLSRISTFPQVVLFLSCCLLPFSAFQVKQIIHITKNALEDDENRMNNLLLLHGTTTFVAKFGLHNRAADTTCLQSKQNISNFQSQIQEMQLLMLFFQSCCYLGEAVTVIVENLFSNRKALVGSVLA